MKIYLQLETFLKDIMSIHVPIRFTFWQTSQIYSILMSGLWCFSLLQTHFVRLADKTAVFLHTNLACCSL